MKKCSGIDTDDLLYRLITEAISTGEVSVSGGVYVEERPDGSEAEDIVVNTISISRDKPQSGTSNINIYAPDLRLRIKGREQRKPDRERLRAIGDAVAEYLEAQNVADLEFWIESDTVLADTQVNQHYRNMRVVWNIH